MKTKEEEFVHELEVFRKEGQSAIQLFYAYLTLQIVAGREVKVKIAFNRGALFWHTNIYALHSSTFITMGRIFDQGSPHNIDKLLSLCQKNQQIFSKKSLEMRRRGDGGNVDARIDDFLNAAYEPSPDDFRRLKKYVARYRKIYDKNYRPIRHQLYAHTELSRQDDIETLYKQTNIREMQRILIFFNQLHHCLRELFNKGRKPVIKPMPYSVRSMLQKEIQPWKTSTIQEAIVKDTESFLLELKKLVP
jgi:hypothetical protein